MVVLGDFPYHELPHRISKGGVGEDYLQVMIFVVLSDLSEAILDPEVNFAPEKA